jgi:hypothetical protein
MKTTEIARMMNISLEKLNNIINHDKSFPRHYAERKQQFGFVSRRYDKQAVIEYFNKTSVKGRVTKKSNYAKYFKILAKFVDRTRPEIKHGSMISKQQCERSTLKLSEQDGELKERFDYNYQRTMK